MKFRLSDLLWLMFAAAIVAGLWVRQHRQPAGPQADEFQIEKMEIYLEASADPVTHITFDDLQLGLKPNEEFDPQRASEKIRNLDGKRVQVTGPMYGAGLSSPANISRFILERNRQNRFGSERPVDEFIEVQMRAGMTTTYRLDTIRLSGILRIAPEKGNDGRTWLIYHLDDATVDVPAPHYPVSSR